ncbi:MAG TPA: TonB-dependent receptor [Gemmatimonadales bacterium]|nr:TonB-dependent receptor [Gemmatimonadales bacterium]
MRADALLLALGVAGCASPLLAQHPDTVAQHRDTATSVAALKKLSVEELMNVQVTSVSRRPEKLSQVPSAIQVITQQDIRRSAASSLPEALRLATNLQVAQVNARQWTVSARGFNGSAANKLLVLIDGRTVYTPLFSGVFWDVQDVPLSDIDRIEVISGPGATLWGTNAVNGVINIITKDAKETQGLLVSGGGGTELRGFGGARYGGTLGPALRFRVYGKGFARQPSVLPSGQDSTDDSHLGQGGLRMDWEAPRGNHVTLQGDLYNGRITQPNVGDVVTSGGNVVARWLHTVSANSNVTAQLYYDRTHRDIPGTFGEFLETYDVDAQHRFRLGSRQDVVWGLGYRLINDHVANSAQLAFLPPHVAREWFSGFVQDEIAVDPERLRVAIGTKVEHNPYTGVEIQPSGRMSWTVSPVATLWAAVSRAVRAPSRIDREFYVPNPAPPPPYFLAGGPNFHSEEELAYELGYRRQSEALALSVATFYNRYYGLRSLEQTNPPQPLPLVIGNGQDGESYGAELIGDYRVTNRWRLHAGYTELRVHVWPKPGSTDQSHGSGESHDPERQFTVTSSADLPANLGFDATVRYVGKIANQQIPDYAELDARLTWQPRSGWSLSAVGQNLLHRQHAEFGSTGGARQIPRGVYGSVEWHF